MIKQRKHQICRKKKHAKEKIIKTGLQAIRNAVECTSIGGDADKNLLRNKDLAKVVRFLSWLISFKNI
jgi:hypothetical protein